MNDAEYTQLLKEQQRANAAREVTEHPLYIEAFEAYRARLMDEWQASPARDKEGREHLWLMLKTAQAVQNHLQTIMQTGQMASLQLEQKRSMLDKARQWTGWD
jgi:hypothetical protein